MYYLKKAIEIQTQKKTPQKWGPLTPNKPATAQYSVQWIWFLVKFLLQIQEKTNQILAQKKLPQLAPLSKCYGNYSREIKEEKKIMLRKAIPRGNIYISQTMYLSYMF